MPEVRERQTIERRTTAPERPPVERRPIVDRRRTTRLVRWLGWLTALVVVAGAGWWGWWMVTRDDTPAAAPVAEVPADVRTPVVPAMTAEQVDLMRLATSGYIPGQAAAASVLPSVGMWNYVRSIEEKDHAWVATAEHLGYTVRGLWISLDGLTWENLDGTVVTVSTPSGEEPTLFFPTAPALSGVTGSQLDMMRLATTGYGDVGQAVLPSVGMWNYVQSVEEKDHAWVATAEHLGYTVRGTWISLDGLTWENLDGLTVTVANPTR